ncbi:hypothetical protein ON010_g6715 [Phytophthora cinnamomi]|nr:hypothetical protein ON010_g6715 [Phytophthora cinnamomi]
MGPLTIPPPIPSRPAATPAVVHTAGNTRWQKCEDPVVGRITRHANSTRGAVAATKDGLHQDDQPGRYQRANVLERQYSPLAALDGAASLSFLIIVRRERAKSTIITDERVRTNWFAHDKRGQRTEVLLISLSNQTSFSRPTGFLEPPACGNFDVKPLKYEHRQSISGRFVESTSKHSAVVPDRLTTAGRDRHRPGHLTHLVALQNRLVSDKREQRDKQHQNEPIRENMIQHHAEYRSDKSRGFHEPHQLEINEWTIPVHCFEHQTTDVRTAIAWQPDNHETRAKVRHYMKLTRVLPAEVDGIHGDSAAEDRHLGQWDGVLGVQAGEDVHGYEQPTPANAATGAQGRARERDQCGEQVVEREGLEQVLLHAVGGLHSLAGRRESVLGLHLARGLIQHFHHLAAVGHIASIVSAVVGSGPAVLARPEQ